MMKKANKQNRSNSQQQQVNTFIYFIYDLEVNVVFLALNMVSKLYSATP